MIRTEAQRARRKRQRDKRKARQKERKMMSRQSELLGFKPAGSYQAWARRNEDYDEEK